MKAQPGAGGPGLSPLGTARQRLEPAAALPSTAVSILEDANLGSEDAFLVWQADGFTASDRLVRRPRAGTGSPR